MGELDSDDLAASVSSSYMWRLREAMAMTSFVDVRESENGFEGRLMME